MKPNKCEQRIHNDRCVSRYQRELLVRNHATHNAERPDGHECQN